MRIIFEPLSEEDSIFSPTIKFEKLEFEREIEKSSLRSC